MSDIDEARLAGWLNREIPQVGQFAKLDKFPTGQSNPTYLLETSRGQYVLRRKPFGPLLPSAHKIEREFRLISALHPVGFPVPEPIALCENQDVIGASFYIMEMVKGRAFGDGTLAGIDRSDRRQFYESMVDTIAALHIVDPRSIGLADFGPSENYVQRQVERWTKQYRASQTDDVPEMEKLIDWLPRTLPEQTRVSIIHGDYRIDNLIFDSTQPSVRAVLDWELATIGDPIADFAYFAMCWAMPQDGGAGLLGIDLEDVGIPTLDEMVDRYCMATGRDDLPDLHWYFAYNLFRLVGIVQGIKKRMVDGNASNAQAGAMAAKVQPLARLAWAEARLAGATD